MPSSPVTVAMYKKAFDQVGPRLDALGLDFDLMLFDADMTLTKDGATVDPTATDLDYLWLSPEVSHDGVLNKAFDLALSLKSLDVLQTFNAGLDHPGYKKVADRGARITNSSAQSVAISEYVLGQVLAMFQRHDEQRAAQAAGEWQRIPFREIAGTNWLIVGFGPIGRATAALAKAFGAHVTVVRRSPDTGPTVDRAGTMADLPAIVPDIDVIVLACPLNEATRGFAGRDFFGRVKRDAILVNIARGGLIDDAALIEALDSGRLAAAALDVFHTEPLPAGDPLWSHPKVRLTAHTSFFGSGTRGRWYQLFLDNLPRYIKGEPLLNEFNPKDLV
jgi:phosphoglycerate dehydrogenase-like enzyme